MTSDTLSCLNLSPISKQFDCSISTTQISLMSFSSALHKNSNPSSYILPFRSVYTTLRSVIENLSSLENLEISLPGPKFVNYCNGARQLLRETVSALPSKSMLKTLSISLSAFTCRAMQWNEGSDSEDDYSETVDHASFWMTLQNFVGECTNLNDFKFEGSQVPMKVERSLQSSSNAKMSFHQLKKSTICGGWRLSLCHLLP